MKAFVPSRSARTDAARARSLGAGWRGLDPRDEIRLVPEGDGYWSVAVPIRQRCPEEPSGRWQRACCDEEGNGENGQASHRRSALANVTWPSHGAAEAPGSGIWPMMKAPVVASIRTSCVFWGEGQGPGVAGGIGAGPHEPGPNRPERLTAHTTVAASATPLLGASTPKVESRAPMTFASGPAATASAARSAASALMRGVGPGGWQPARRSTATIKSVLRMQIPLRSALANVARSRCPRYVDIQGRVHLA